MTSYINKSTQSNLDDEKVAFIGTGRMASALISEFIRQKKYKSNQIIATHPKSNEFTKQLRKSDVEVIASNSEAVSQSKIVYLCIRPQDIHEMIEEFSDEINEKHTLISIAVGVPLAWLREKLPKCGSIFHIHPSSLVMASAPGISYITFEKNTPDSIQKQVDSIWKSLGDTIIVEEDEMDFCAVFSGMSPAFFSRLAIIWKKLAKQYGGFTNDEADKIVMYIFKGFGYAINEGKLNFENMEERIATPGGVTRAGIKALTEREFEKTLEEVVMSSLDRIKEIRSIYTSQELP